MTIRNLFARLGFSTVSIAVAVDAFARAGGGGHDGGGGGYSSSSGSFSSNPSFPSSAGGGMIIQVPPGVVLFLLLVFFVVFAMCIRWSKRQASLTSQSAGGPSATGVAPPLRAASAAGHASVARQSNRPELPDGVASIASADPGFEIETFLQRAEMSFFLVKRGLERNDSAAIRPYLADPLFAELSRTIANARTQHRHNLLESLNVRALHVVDAAASERGQSLVVHFDIVYRAKSFDDAKRVLADEDNDARHAERWTFVRAANASTPTVGNVTASRCPACGAELQLSLDANCTHCGASLTNGSVDWVVADIRPAAFVGYTSESQPAAAAPSVADGIARLHTVDPAFSIDAFRVRARTAFGALQDAWCKQNLDAARAFLSPGAYFAWRAQLETMAVEGRRNVMEHLQVQSIQPLRIVHGRVFDDLTVRIAASSADYDVDKDGRIIFGDRTVRPFVEEWTFQRSVSATTTNKPGTLENTCPCCGAPVALTQLGECRYCKAAITSGKFDWVVSRIEQEDGEAGAGSAAA
jgi:predicted lipid-binding transport protein (Tim44 family)